MDTLTHGLLGAAASQALFAKKLPRGAGLIGLVAGMAPDLDLFMGSATDPVASILYHRQFSHSLIFIPLGALLVSLLFIWVRPFKAARPAVYGAALVGYGLHGPLDACTSYGTLLLWPFSYTRVAWDVIAIVDPIFTLTLLAGVLWTVVRRHAGPAQVAVCLALIYLGFGVWQWHRALGIQYQLAAARGQTVEYGRVMPLPGSLVAWRSVYMAAGHIYVDGVRVPWWSSALVRPGGHTPLATFDSVPRPLAERDGTRRVFEVFAWFADGLIAPIDGMPTTIGDMRYAAEAHSLTPLWGMQFDGQRAEGPVRWRPPNSSRARIVANIWRALTDDDPDYRPVNEVLAPLQRRS
ncbi:MAG TPA: metal-dependent hydrolase [Candidatus Tectomicrobia bacterium]|nr:metal-dependent hydrolase [Candidatus Tectomicrobia bacterium]